MKGNPGRRERQSRVRRTLLIGSSAASLVLLVYMNWARWPVRGENHLDLFGVGDLRPPRSDHILRNSLADLAADSQKDGFSTIVIDEQTSLENQAWQDILHARVHLVDLLLHDVSDVSGVFCRIDWSLHKRDPSSVAAFRELTRQSVDCQQRRIQVDLNLAIRRIHDFERKNGKMNQLDFSGAVFHESRCGSTLVANLLASMNPAQHRVYSESRPPVVALTSQGSPERKSKLLRNVVYLMSRSDDAVERRVFFKFQSIASQHIEVFRQAFPDQQWLFVYRDPAQVLVSYLSKSRNPRNAKCALRQFHRPPKQVVDLIRRHGKRVAEISPVEYCAAHLATLTKTATVQLQESESRGMAINYQSLPAALWQEVLPKHWGIVPTAQEIERMERCGSQYSKGMHGKGGSFVEDSQQKDRAATPEVQHAANIFLAESYQALETLREEIVV